MNYKLNRLAEFVDKNRELEFRKHAVEAQRLRTRRTVLVLCCAYFLLSVFDLLDPLAAGHIGLLLLSRGAVLAAGLLFFFVFSKTNKPAVFSASIALISLVTFFSYLYIIRLTYSNQVMGSTIGVILIILCAFLSIDRWRYALSVSALMTCLFMVFAVLYYPAEYHPELPRSASYMIMASMLCALNAYQVSHYKRTQFDRERQLHYLSETDKLTGIYNRVFFDSELAKSCQLGKPFSLVIFDFDDFKEINDVYGHLVGDMVLIETAKLVLQSIRSDDIFARWGGEEFIILFPDTELTIASELAERIRKLISEHYFEGVERVTCSFGATGFLPGDTPYSLVNRVDDFLYKAKRTGKNNVVS